MCLSGKYHLLPPRKRLLKLETCIEKTSFPPKLFLKIFCPLLKRTENSMFQSGPQIKSFQILAYSGPVNFYKQASTYTYLSIHQKPYNNNYCSVPIPKFLNCPMHDSPFLTLYSISEVKFSPPTLQQFELCVNASLKVNFQPYYTSLEGLQDNKLSVSR